MASEKKKSRPGAPSTDHIRDRRKDAGLKQDEAGELLHTTKRVWSQWERGLRQMHPAFWELFGIKTETLVRRRAKKQALSGKLG
jgi:DNA (cytosine-5)-methyltransferase 1